MECCHASMDPRSTSSASRAASSSCPAATTWNATSTATTIGPCMRTVSKEHVRAMLDYDFMQNAFEAATVVAIVSGLVGYFLVLRGQAFAAHALSHVGFTGATAAVLIGTTPLWGMILATVAAGIGIGLMGEHLHQRDVAIGIVLALMLGLGLLFLHFFTAYATQVTALLFGNVLAVDVRTLAFYTDWPSSFWITALSAGVYLFAALQPTGWMRQPV